MGKAIHFALPMAALSAKTGDCQMQALVQYVGPLLEEIKRGSTDTALTLTTDWAKANRLLFRKLVRRLGMRLALHSKCNMHQTALGIGAAVGPLKVVGALFCGANVLQHGSTQQRLALKLEQHLRNNVDIVVEDTRSPEHITFVDGLLDLLHWDEALLSSAPFKRPAIAKEKLESLINDLKTFLHAPLDQRRWVHFCSFGCCSGGPEESKARLVELLSLLFINRIPGTPALNKWTQLYPSFSWWCVASHLHKFLPVIWSQVFPDAAAEESVLDLLAPASEETLSALHKVRAGKARRWLWHPKTAAELLIVCMSLRAVLSFMGFLFKQERALAPHSITKLMEHPSACTRVVFFLVSRLGDLDTTFWAVYRYEGLDEWKLQLALDTILRLAASLCYRLMYSLDLRPWALWKLLDTAQPDAERRNEANVLRGACPQCLDPLFTEELLRGCTVDDLLDETSPHHKRARACFEHCRATNIMSETRFARVTKLLNTSKFGRACSASTVASKHFLSEFSSMHKQAVEAWARKHPMPLIEDSRRSKKASSGWHEYLAEGRRTGMSMAQIGVDWRAMTDAEKAPYEERAVAAQEQAGHAAIDLGDLAFPTSATPLGVGSESLPLRSEVAAELCEGDAIEHGKQAWREQTGKLVPEPAQSFDAAGIPALRCDELYGPRQCVSRLSAEVKARCDALRSALRHAACVLSKQTSVQLLYLRPAGEADDQVPQHVFCMISFSLLKDPEACL